MWKVATYDWSEQAHDASVAEKKEDTERKRLNVYRKKQ
jgi:hypothetical protein